MSLTKIYGVRAGAQVPLDVANKQSSQVSDALREREALAASAAEAAVEKALKQHETRSKRLGRTLRAPAKGRKD